MEKTEKIKNNKQWDAALEPNRALSFKNFARDQCFNDCQPLQDPYRINTWLSFSIAEPAIQPEVHAVGNLRSFLPVSTHDLLVDSLS